MTSNKKKIATLKELINKWIALQEEIKEIKSSCKILTKKSNKLQAASQKIMEELELDNNTVEITDNTGHLQANITVNTKKVKSPINLPLINKILCDSLNDEELASEICEKIEQERKINEYKYLKQLKVKKE
jgi:gamma-glutamyl:cysteine ligase YbdK (ATP-grasp superfamily)